MEAITIVLNGVEVSGYPGTTILELARESGVYIPTLCNDPNLVSIGACRLCIVEDERNGALLASCVTPISPGMIINTNSPRVLEHRKKILKLMLASHPDSCLVCDKGNRCQLRKLAAEMGIGLVEFQRIPQSDTIEEVNPFIERDLSKCIMCGKCIRADQELVVEGAIDYIHRGASVKAATLNDLPLEKSECTFCGVCVAICPTGAIMEKDRAYTGTATTMVTSVCPYCGCGCAITLGVKDGKIIYTRPVPESPVSRGTLCVRGSYGYDFIHSKERLNKPLVKVNGDFQEATWEEALALAAENFKRIKEIYGPDALAVFGSPKCTNEENYLLQRFARGVLGTNNIDNSNRLYCAASLTGLGVTVGYAGTTGSINYLERSQIILVIGANPEISAPAVAYAIKRAVKFNGAKLIIIDPRYTPLSNFAQIHLRSSVGTDVPLLNGLARIIINEKKLDEEFVTRMTDNFNNWSKSLEKYTAVYVEKTTGIPKKDIQTAARLLGEAENTSIVYGNGITQQANGTETVIAIANLAMLTGNAGRRGGIFALQRHNNARGACDMGVVPNFLPGYLGVNDTQNRQKFEGRWNVKLPADNGLTALEMMEAARKGKVKGMFIMGENPVASFPQPKLIKEALTSLEFLVVTDMFPGEAVRLASVVLPATSFAEKEGTFTNFEGRIQSVRKAIIPFGDSRPDSEIIMQLSLAMGSPMLYSSPHQVMEEIEEMVPFYHKVSPKDADTMGLEMGEVDGDTPGTRRFYKGLFPSGFGRFQPVDFTPLQESKNGYNFTLITGSSRYHFGTGAWSQRSSRLRRFSPESFLEINPADAKELGFKDEDKIQIISEQGEISTSAKVSNVLPKGLLYMADSFPQSPVRELFGTVIDPRSKTPALKSCAVRLERITADDQAKGNP
ncbi:MAG: formate dehydrogenase subunit alpha [Dehalococcoidales bacterium]|nr:formate dehydrogenase subunit alpha [Dehalococcoidales bacterium]